MNASGFRVCVKELYVTRYDPVSVSYAVLSGQWSTVNHEVISRVINFGDQFSDYRDKSEYPILSYPIPKKKNILNCKEPSEGLLLVVVVPIYAR